MGKHWSIEEESYLLEILNNSECKSCGAEKFCETYTDRTPNGALKKYYKLINVTASSSNEFEETETKKPTLWERFKDWIKFLFSK